MKQKLTELFRDYFMNPHDPETPCLHMKPLLSDLSDDTAKGIARLYTQQHVAGCKGCAYTLNALKEMRVHLRQLRELPRKDQEILLDDEHWNALEAAWEELDTKVKNNA